MQLTNQPCRSCNYKIQKQKDENCNSLVEDWFKVVVWCNRINVNSVLIIYRSRSLWCLHFILACFFWGVSLFNVPYLPSQFRTPMWQNNLLRRCHIRYNYSSPNTTWHEALRNVGICGENWQAHWVFAKTKCVIKMTTLSSFLTVLHFFIQANNARKRFVSPDGDHITYINVLRLYIQEAEMGGSIDQESTSNNTNSSRNKKTNKRVHAWCTANFVNGRSLRRAVDIQKWVSFSKCVLSVWLHLKVSGMSLPKFIFHVTF